MFVQLPNAAAGTGISKDSIVTVWGTVGPPYSCSTRLGSNSVPTVIVKYIEKATRDRTRAPWCEPDDELLALAPLIVAVAALATSFILGEGSSPR